MKIHEYQAKDILARYGVSVQPGIVATTVEEAVAAAEKVKGDMQNAQSRIAGLLASNSEKDVSARARLC